MTIDVATPDGGVAHFPDGTAPDVMRNALRAKFGGGPAKQVAGEIQKGQLVASGDIPVKSMLQSAKENLIPSAVNLVKGTFDTATEAAKALANPDPRVKLDFVKNLAVGMYQTYKERYGQGLEHAVATDPAGFIADVLSVGFGIRGVRSGGGAEVPTRAATRGTAIVERDMATDVANKTATGVGPTPMDRGGTAVANQVERLANTSGGGRDIIVPFLERRQSESFARITGQLKALSGSTRTARQALDETMAAQQKAAIPAYTDAYQAGDRVIWNEEIERLTGHPDVQSAMTTAVRRWQGKQIEEGYGAAKPGAMVAGETVDTNTIVSHPNMGGKMLKITGGRVPVMPNLQFWDYTRRSIDGMIDGQFRPDGRLSERGRGLVKIRNQINAQLDILEPKYKDARAAWSGPESYKNALEFGNGVFSESADNFIADFNNLKGADKQAARESVVTKIVSDLERSSTGLDVDLRDLTRKLKTRDNVRKILAILPEQSRQSYLSSLKAEVRSSKVVGQGLKNSATAKRLAMAEDAKNLVGDMVLGMARGAADVASGGITAKLRMIVSGSTRVLKKIQASADAEAAKILTGQKTSTKIQNRIGNRSPLLLPALTSQQ